MVGDKKTPSDWSLENCEYLSPDRQLELGYDLAKILPWNSYGRKNIGYLFAIESGAKIIYETDDDNEPIGQLEYNNPENILTSLTSSQNSLNVYSYFGHPEIWPRGFPLEQIAYSSQYEVCAPTHCKIGIEQGIVNNAPDVDAIFRLTQDKIVEFPNQLPCYLPKGIFCPFNSQNTFIHPVSYFTLYIPSIISMRVSDIWRGYIAQKLIWSEGANLIFSGPNAIQYRNEHSLSHDFMLEIELYLKSNKLVNFLEKLEISGQSPTEKMLFIYRKLANQEFLSAKELPLVEAWLSDFEKVTQKK